MRRRLSYRQLEIRGMDDLLKDFGQEMLTPDFLPSPKDYRAVFTDFGREEACIEIICLRIRHRRAKGGRSHTGFRRERFCYDGNPRFCVAIFAANAYENPSADILQG